MTTNDELLVFRTPNLPESALRVVRFRAREAVSRLYRIDLVLEAVSSDPDLVDNLHLALGAPGTVTFGLDGGHPFHGIVSEVRLEPDVATGRPRYRVRLVPRMALLAQNVRSRVFQDMSVPEIVAHVLGEIGLGSGDGASFRLSAPHPKREFTVQYQETDHAFVSRLLEYEGMFYFFEQAEKAERLLVGDSNYAFVPIEDRPTLPFLPPGGARSSGETGISSISQRRRLIERNVRVLDYNYRTPAVALAGAAAVDAAEGFGDVTLYGEHFKTVDDGARVAQLRAEERAARKEIYAGHADVRGHHAGQTFKLEDHEVTSFDQEYVTLEVRHAADAAGAPGATSGARGYRTRLTAIPLRVPFRPELSTPRPRLDGLLHAKIDGTQKTSIDEHGRYKVLLPFDAATLGTGLASRWIRMAQPSAGAAGKMHFPLEVGTEVVLAHVAGDPDRPIIVGAVPNHATPSPVIAANALQSIIHSRAGIRMILDDNPGPDVGS